MSDQMEARTLILGRGPLAKPPGLQAERPHLSPKLCHLLFRQQALYFRYRTSAVL